MYCLVAKMILRLCFVLLLVLWLIITVSQMSKMEPAIRTHPYIGMSLYGWITLWMFGWIEPFSYGVDGLLTPAVCKLFLILCMFVCICCKPFCCVFLCHHSFGGLHGHRWLVGWCWSFRVVPLFRTRCLAPIIPITLRWAGLTTAAVGICMPAKGLWSLVPGTDSPTELWASVWVLWTWSGLLQLILSQGFQF